MLAADDVLVGLVGDRVVLTLDPEGAAITNLATAYDAPAGRLTITAETAGTLGLVAPVNGIAVDSAIDTITVDLKKVTTFAGLSIVGGDATDSIRVGPGGVNLAAIGRGSAAKGFTIDTGGGAADSIIVGGRIAARGAGSVSLATEGEGVAHGILLASGVVAPGGSQTFRGGVTLLNGVGLRAGGGISFSSTIDGFGRLRLSAGTAITFAGDIGGRLPLQGITVARAGRVFVGEGLVLDGAGAAAGSSGFVIGANVHRVVFSSASDSRTISGFEAAGIRFAGGSVGSRIRGVTSTGNGVGLLVGDGDYTGTVVSGSSFSDNVGDGVSLRAARGIRIGGRAQGAGNEIVSNGGFGVAAKGRCEGSIVAGSEIGDNAVGQIENYLAGTLSGSLLVQDATGLTLRLDDVGRAAYRVQNGRSYSFDVGVEAFVVSARSTGWLDTRSATLDIDSSFVFMVPVPGSMVPPELHRTAVGENLLATSLTPMQALSGLSFAKSVEYVGRDAYGRHYRALVGSSTFAGMIPLADLGAVPNIGGDGGAVPVDVWVNRQGRVSRIAASFEGGGFTMSLRGHRERRFVAAPSEASIVGTVPEASVPEASVPEASALAATEIRDVGAPHLPGTANGVTGVRDGRSTLAIPFGDALEVPADWYFPTQVDGSVVGQGVIWLQHATGADGGSLSSLAIDLARQTNSIVVAPSLPATMAWSLAGNAARRAVASLFEGDRSALTSSAVAAGHAGVLPGKFVLAGHSAGGGFATAVAADYVANNPEPADLVGVVMYDGVSRGAFDGSGSFAGQVAALDSRGIPVYQVASPSTLWNAYGATTNALVAGDTGRFRGVVLAEGSHVDAMVAGSNAAAARMLTAGWINDIYAGATPSAPLYGRYAPSNTPIQFGDATAIALPSPVANLWSPDDARLDAELAEIGGLAGFQPGPVVNGGGNGLSATVAPQHGNGVTGVTSGSSSLGIPFGARGYTTSAEWYFPTRADGSVSANGIVWLQRGEGGDTAAFAALAAQIAGQTNSIVVAPAISSFEIPTLPGCFLGGEAMQQAVADMMIGGRGELATSAAAAGYAGVLPAKILFVGQRTGGGFAATVGSFTVDNGAAMNLMGVVMIDGVAGADTFAQSLAKLDSLGIPAYQIASRPQAANDWGSVTELLALLHPGQFVGVQIDDGDEVSLDAAIAISTGWINDIYSGEFGPTNPSYGFYGNPNDGTYIPNVPITLGEVGATTLPAPPPVDIDQYAGRWYEQGSVKVPSVVLVNVTATFTPQPDGSVRVENSGNYSGPDGEAWSTNGSAIPVNAFNTRLSVDFVGEPETDEPGNYWILDYAPDYSWAIVSDPTGSSGGILTRQQVIADAEYDALVARAYRLGVRGTITRTAQYPILPP